MSTNLLLTAFANSFVAIGLYVAEKKTAVGKMKCKWRQVMFGLIFGAMAIYSSTPWGSIDVGGALVNVRDSAPLCAGLIFGAPAGIIAGIMGGVYRYAAVFWGGAGEYTQIACSVSTILAGFIAAALRRFMFDNKKPTWMYGVGIGMITEVVHMLMIFFTNMSDTTAAFEFVRICTLPMVLGNGLSVGLAVFGVTLAGRETVKNKKDKKQISETFQFWLLVCIVIAFAVTSVFTFVLNTGIAETQTESVLQRNLSDVDKDISDASDENLLEKTRKICGEYAEGNDLSTLAEKYNVAEINIVDENGMIVNANNPEYVGYMMESGEQSAEFLCLLTGEEENFVQQYMPMSYDNETLRKYGAVKLENGGFLQVGYDAVRFKKDIDDFVGKVAKNRHVGSGGFITVCDEKFDIVTENSEHFGENLYTLGIWVDTENVEQGQVFETSIGGETYLCAYRFVEGYYIIGAMPKAESMFMNEVSVYVSTFMEMVIFAALFILIYFLIKKIVIDNIKRINRTLAQITDGNLNVTVDVRSNEEFASLSDDINSTVSTLKRYIDEAAARIDKELEFAKQIQYSSLPSVFPKRREFDVYAQMYTAKEVGGDFYDFYMLDEVSAAFLIADVSGKGIPAAMFMMRAKTIIKDLAENGAEPGEIFEKANMKLCENNDAGMFVTAWLGILNLKTGILQFANAGHNPPLLCAQTGEFEYLKARSGLVLAGMENVKYRQNELKLAPGDKIFLYTDGVTEATDNDRRLYGEERLKTTLGANCRRDAREMCLAVKDDVDAFAGDAPQFDDITMLALCLNSLMSENRLEVVPNEKTMEIVNDFTDKLAKKLGVVPKTARKINIIFDEMCANIIKYSKATWAAAEYETRDGKLCITFEDNGVPYDPTKAEAPDVTLPCEERKIGGLGIFMVKSMADEMSYEYTDKKNVLKINIKIEGV